MDFLEHLKWCQNPPMETLKKDSISITYNFRIYCIIHGWLDLNLAIF